MHFTGAFFDIALNQAVNFHQGHLIWVSVQKKTPFGTPTGTQKIVFNQLLQNLGRMVFGKTGDIGNLLGIQKLFTTGNDTHAVNGYCGGFRDVKNFAQCINRNKGI